MEKTYISSTTAGIRMAVLPTGKGTRGYPTLLGKGKGIEFYPRVRVRVQNSTRGQG
jgi:hypothetical protein